MTYEIEACLLVTGDDPAAVMQHVAALETLAGHVLAPSGTRVQRDAYVDTPDGAIRARRHGLRIRTREGRADEWTLKGPPVLAGAASTTRLELNGLERVVAELRRLGIDADPRAMTPVQSRTTGRTMRLVGDEAELALDVVTYEVGGRRLVHREIEIEARNDDAGPLVETLTGTLLRDIDDLRPWPHSKLVTGFALEALEASGELAALMREGGLPTAALYDAIEREVSAM